MKRFSVVIPNRGREDLLYKAIESVLQQSFSDYEIVIVDDSIDTIHRKIVDKMRPYSNIRVIKGPSSGSANARLVGIKESEGEIIALLDSDDRWHPNKLLLHSNCHEKLPDVDVCFDQLIEEKDGKSKKILLPFDREFISGQYERVDKVIMFRKLVQENFIHMSCGSFKNNGKTVELFPINEPQDYLFWLRISTRSDFGLVPSYETVKLIHTDSRGNRRKILLEENLLIQKEKLKVVLKNRLLSTKEKTKYFLYAILSMLALHIILPFWIKKRIIRKNKLLLFRMLE